MVRGVSVGRSGKGKERGGEGKERSGEGKERSGEGKERSGEGKERGGEGKERSGEGKERSGEGKERRARGDAKVSVPGSEPQRATCGGLVRQSRQASRRELRPVTARGRHMIHRYRGCFQRESSDS